VIYLITFCLLVLRWKEVLPVISRSKFVWLLFGLAALSIFWSYSPDLTRTRVVALFGTMMFSLYLASHYSLKEQLHLLGWIFGAIIVASLLFVIFLPNYGMMGGFHAGAWRGIYNHKNVLGKIMVPSAIVFYLLSLDSKNKRWVLWSFLAASVFLMLLTKAASPLVNLTILMILLSILPILRWNYLFMVPVIIGVASVGILLYLSIINNSAELVGALGKDLTFTGRTNFWPLMIDKIWEKPLLGYGFGAFWQGLDGPSAYVWNAADFKAPNGHNGYLDICLELGFVGLSIYTIQYIISLRKALSSIKISRTPEIFWPILLLCYVVLSNLTESVLVLQNNFLWILQLSVFFALPMQHSTKVNNSLLEEV
jgi:exopolysaccharide production protein ExoQ